jgi:lipid II:glycine glycyltransferase (peptidoglycan interpeptide bridge formation enzyme)
MKDLRQSPEFAHFMEKIGWTVKKEKGIQIYIRHLPILGNFIKIQRPEVKISTGELENLAKKYKAFAIQLNYSPTKTLRLDLKKSEKEILKQMKKDCRYEIRKAEREKILVKQSLDIESFIKIWHENAFKRGFWIPFDKEIRSIYHSFGRNAYLLLAYQQSSKPIAGALILIFDKTAYYFHAASTPKGRKLSASYLIIFKAIKLAKRKGCKIFDFEGIYDERSPIKSWQGFTHFKKSFGGKEIEYPLSFTKFYNPFLELASKFFSKIPFFT